MNIKKIIEFIIWFRNDNNEKGEVCLMLKLQYQKKIIVKSDNEPILSFDYNGGYVNVKEGAWLVFQVEYSSSLDGRRIRLEHVDIMDKRFQYCGYGTACMREILFQLEGGNVELISAKLGNQETPPEFKTRRKYLEFLKYYYERLGFEVDIEHEDIRKSLH